MDATGLLVFATALLVAGASPGPAIAALVARVLGRGIKGSIAFSMGVALGDVVWLTFAIVGLATVAQAFHEVFVVVKYAGAAYLLFLAYKLWSTPPQTLDEPVVDAKIEHPLRPFLGGLALTLGNPKTMVFYLALLPTLIDLRTIDWIGYAELVPITFGVLGSVFAGYIFLAAKARRLFSSPRSLRVINRTTGAMMAGAAVAIASR